MLKGPTLASDFDGQNPSHSPDATVQGIRATKISKTRREGPLTAILKPEDRDLQRLSQWETSSAPSAERVQGRCGQNGGGPSCRARGRGGCLPPAFPHVPAARGLGPHWSDRFLEAQGATGNSTELRERHSAAVSHCWGLPQPVSMVTAAK